jgi:hypothetical protein
MTSYNQYGKPMDEMWNEAIGRRCVGRNCRECGGTGLRWYGHIFRRDEEELVRDIME